MPLNADQRAGPSPNDKPSYTVEQAAVQLDRAGVEWGDTLGQAATVTYAFRASAPAAMPDDTGGFSRFTAAQISAAQLSLEAWSDVANITFQRVGTGTTGSAAYSNNATILFGDYSTGEDGAAAFTYLPSSPSERQASSMDGDVWVNITDTDNQNPTVGDYGQQTLTHELGHAIGLSHPSDYDAGDSNATDPTYEANASYYEDSREYSIMSYFASSNTGGVASIFNAAPQIDDIAAAQRLYGANMATRDGDTTYGFNSNTDRPWYSLTSATDHFYASVWDGGGNDTFDFSGYTQNQRIDLHQGAFSDVGGDVGNLSIAIGADIENAIGGSGDDSLTGNALNNHLYGGAGNDTLAGAGGTDTLDGGAGTDTVSYSLPSGAYVTTLHAAAGTVTGGPEGSDTLVSIEDVAFADGVLTFDPNSAAAEVYRLYGTFVGRAPDAAGFDSFIAYLQSGHTLAQAAAGAAASAEFQADTAGLSNVQYVTYLYEHALGREPETSGLDANVAGLDAGGSRVALALAFSESPEHVAETQSALDAGFWEPDTAAAGVILLYDAAVGRLPDSGGLANFEREYAAGESFRQIANEMSGSAEFLARFGALDDKAFVDALYQDALHRVADPGGEAGYTAELSHGYTRGDVLYQFAMSEEHQSLVLAHYDPLLATPI